MQLVVLGMHRSGTSALTRVLNLMGCYAGDADAFNPVEPDNPKGYWERRDVWALNEELLAALDASWCRVGRLDLDELPDDRRASFERQAAEIVATLDRHRPWVIKDPRLCVLFPVWRAVLENPVCLIPRRSPLEIAASLATRDGFPIDVSLALWERYTRDALSHSEGLPRVFVDHAALIHRPLETARQLASDLAAVGVEGLAVPDEPALTEFIDPALHRATADAADERRRVTPARRDLVDALESGDPVPSGDTAGGDLLAGYFDRIAERDDLARQLNDASAKNDTLRAETSLPNGSVSSKPGS